jgi:Ca2+-binding RTX toxin-like protein
MANINGNDFFNFLFGTNEADTINGFGGDDSIIANGGDDLINGGAGGDAMAGGLGNDSYFVDRAHSATVRNDIVIENPNEGTDTVFASVSFSLFSAPNVENLTLIGTALGGVGNELDNVITGNDLENSLAGNDGNDTVYGLGGNDNSLEGGAGDDFIDGGVGDDRMSGSSGNDTYVVDSVGDEVTELSATDGIDTVRSSVSYTLGAHLENLVLLETSDINATGNELDNVLTGNAGSNILDGKAGKDTLIGGLGNDLYIVDSLGDVVTEAANEGIDTVQSSVSYVLGDHVENLLLIGTANIDATGNALDNILTGNAGNNILDGKGGNDSLIGGLGDDTYVVSEVGDTVTETANAGVDTVNAAISYTLGDNLENLTLTGTGNINGTGNALRNTLTGNAGNNILNGKEGDDTLIGGLGNDIYIVNDAGDQVSERFNEGVDVIAASVSYTLSDNVEHIGLTGTDNLNATGNTLDNVLLGNVGVNTLDGDAGNDILIGVGGRDTLKGGTGADKFVFTAPTDRVDRILDFSKQERDQILLVSNGFTGLKAGNVKQKQFVLGNKAKDKNDRLIYNQKNGALFYDADGKGGTAQVRIATFANKPALGVSDFIVSDAPATIF